MNSNTEVLGSLAIGSPLQSIDVDYSHAIPVDIRTNVIAYLRDGYAQALHCDYAYDTFEVNYRSHTIEALRIGESVFFMLDSGSYLDFQMTVNTIFFLMS